MAGIRAPTLDLAREAFHVGITQDQVIAGLQARIQRDRLYLDRRKRNGQHTVYDEQTAQDGAYMALAVCWLMEETTYHDLLTLFVALQLRQLATPRD
jgi:hypothetical protein